MTKPDPRKQQPSRAVWRGTPMALCAAVALSATPVGAAAPVAPRPALLPWPEHVELGQGQVTIRNGTAIVVPPGDAKAMEAAHYLADLLRRTRGLALPVRVGRPGGGVAIHIASSTPTVSRANARESYGLTIDSHGPRIEAGTAAGLLYGSVSLWEVLTQGATTNGPATIPLLHIEDRPRFAWRGLMLDSARHVQSPAFVERLIDWMALHKLNTLHWHLVDDQGWRLEIKRYPRLTQVGAWRVEAGAGAARDIDPATGQPRLYGGFYTQDDVRRIVAHAARRNVTIVPEIEMPGHASAILAAYPELGTQGAPPATVSHDWGVHANLLGTQDATFTFLQNVLTEVMALFPSPYIHIGGDEAVKDQWKASPVEQARMKALGLADEEALQSWYTQRIEAFLNAHGRRLIGWDELLKGGLAPDATVMSWHGVAGAIAAAKSGHDAVVTPSRPLYLNYRQSEDASEPPGRAPVNSLADVYNFDPAPAELTDAQRHHVLGLQAGVWTEHVRTEERIEHMLFPRLAALAEVAWSPEASHDLRDFEARLVPEMARYRRLGLRAADSAFAVRATVRASGSGAEVTLGNQLGFGTIRYTLDGSAPTTGSPPYVRPLHVGMPATVRAASFADGQAIVPPSLTRIDAASLLSRSSAQLSLCKEAGAIAMEDDAPLAGPRAVFVVNYIDRCWIDRQAPLDGIGAIRIDMGSIPFNLQLRDGGTARMRMSPDGKDWLEVHADRCDGPLLARLSLDPVRKSDTITPLTAPLPQMQGAHDLCLLTLQPRPDPIWTIDAVHLLPRDAAPANP